MAGPTLAQLEREKALQVRKMLAEGMSLAERRERRAARVCGSRFQGGEGTEHLRGVPGPEEGGQAGRGHPRRREGAGGSERREGLARPPRQDGRGREAAGVRGRRSEGVQPAAGPGPGQRRAAPRKTETFLGFSGAIPRPCP